MIKCTIANGLSITENTGIALAQVINNDANRFGTTANGIMIKRPGLYRVDVNIPVTAVADTPVTMQVYANGVSIPTAVDAESVTATTGTVTLSVSDIVNVVSTSITSGYLTLSVQLTENATTAAMGTVTVMRVE